MSISIEHFDDPGLWIPPITDPLGRHWHQPDRERILIDETHAVMFESDLRMLKEYSTSRPSGVYTGKMWKALDDNQWWLAWYGLPSSETTIWTHFRKILILKPQTQ